MKDAIVNHISDCINVKQLLAQDVYINIIEKIARAIITAYENNKKVILCGNGGSASDALHIEGELVGRFKMERRALPAIAIVSGSSTMTAIGNDYGYDSVFSRQVEAHGMEGDVLLGFSTSGNSPNVIDAVLQAKSSGMITIGMLGKTGGILKNLSDISLIVPSDDTPRIQECHILVGHVICDIVEKALFIDNSPVYKGYEKSSISGSRWHN